MTTAPGTAPTAGLFARFEAAPGGSGPPTIETLVLELNAQHQVTKASGTVRTGAGGVAWSADLAAGGAANVWAGKIHPTAQPGFPWIQVDIDVRGPQVRAVLTDPAAQNLVQNFDRSGRYEALPAAPVAAASAETLVLDVDGPYALYKTSGVMPGAAVGAASDLHWFADLTPPAPANPWTGAKIHLHQPPPGVGLTALTVDAAGATVRVVFTGGGGSRTEEFVRRGPCREIEVELECTSDCEIVDALDTRPLPPVQDAPPSPVTLWNVFEHAGCRLTRAPGPNGPISMVQPDGSQADEVWEDNELHDAISRHWEHGRNNGRNKPAWALWVLFAKKYRKENVAGLMFDKDDGNQRQGAVVFADSSFYHNGQGVPVQGPALHRFRFWCAVHEMAHCFNLPHAWEAANQSPPWLACPNQPDFPTFMNYPWPAEPANPNRAAAYFSQFAYRFSNEELRFLRHAPEHLVKMGAAPFGNGTPGANAAGAGAFALEVRLRGHESAAGIKQLEYMEPLVLEVKLTNNSDQPVPVPEARITVRYKAPARPHDEPSGDEDPKARRDWERPYVPYAHTCGGRETVEPGHSSYEQVFVSAGVRATADGRCGWLVKEPGTYAVLAEVCVDGLPVPARPLEFEVREPGNDEQRSLGDRYFSDKVARFLAFDGSNLPDSGLDTLQEVIRTLPGSRAAVHARIALASLRRRRTKLLDPERGRIETRAEDHKAAEAWFRDALTADTPATLGHLDFEYYAMQRATMLLTSEGPVRALAAWDDAIGAMEKAIAKPPPPGVREKWAAFRKSLGGPPPGPPETRSEPQPRTPPSPTTLAGPPAGPSPPVPAGTPAVTSRPSGPSRPVIGLMLGLTALVAVLAGAQAIGLFGREAELQKLRDRVDVLTLESKQRADEHAALIAKVNDQLEQSRAAVDRVTALLQKSALVKPDEPGGLTGVPALVHPPMGTRPGSVKPEAPNASTDPTAAYDLEGLRAMSLEDVVLEHKERMDLLDALRKKADVPADQFRLAEEAAQRAAAVLREKKGRRAEPPPPK